MFRFSALEQHSGAHHRNWPRATLKETSIRMRVVSLIPAALLVLIAAQFLPAQNNPQLSARAAENRNQVRLRLRLLPVGSQGDETPREAAVTLQRLDAPGAPASFSVKSNALTVVTLNPGRYELTTTRPVQLNGHWYGWDIEIPVTEPTNDVTLSAENALQVAPPTDTPRAEDDLRGAPAIATSGPALVDEQTRAAITDLLNTWTSSLKQRNLEAQMSCYAPRLTTYFLQHNVTKAEVRRDKQRFFERYPNIRELAISNVQISRASGTPEATLLKTWNFGGYKDWKGQVVSHLTFEKQNGRWVISAERERLVQESVPFASAGASPE